jgi:DNA (cytosine-5)-methyltransferase 1
VFENHPQDSRVKEMGDTCHSVTARWGTGGGNVPFVKDMAVRKLTPVECERLQGFPDNYTNIKENCPDGHRYKAMGNSMAVPVMRWIGERINNYKEENYAV